MSIENELVITQILDGDTEAYAILVDRYKQALYRHCFYIVRNEVSAEDIAQDTFIKAYTKLGRFDARKASFKTWLFTIGTRLCLDHLKAKANNNLPLLCDESWVDDAQQSPEDVFRDRELYDKVQNLPPLRRAVVMLHYWHGYTYEDVAASTGIPLNTVRSHIRRAKQQLREELS